MPPMKPETLPEMDAYRHNAAERQIGNLLSCLGSGVRVDAVRVLAPRIYEGGGKSSAHWYRGEPVIRISFTKAREEEQQTQKDNSI